VALVTYNGSFGSMNLKFSVRSWSYPPSTLSSGYMG